MNAPPLMLARTAAEVETILRGLAGVSGSAAGAAATYAPSHIVDVSEAGAVDLIGSWHLESEGGDAELLATPYAPRFRGMHTTYGSTYTWKAASSVPFNFSTQSWAVMFVNVFHVSPPDLPVSSGGGGFFIGNMKGPHKDNPFLGNGVDTYGDDRGWGMSANGDGGLGLQLGGTGGWLNVDTDDVNVVDGKVRVHVGGYHDVLGIGFMLGGGFTRIIDPTDPGGGGLQNDPVDITSTDGSFALRCEYPYLSCHATQEMFRLIVFENAAAENLYAYHSAFMPALQRSLTASGSVAAIVDSMAREVRALAPSCLLGDRFTEVAEFRHRGGFREWAEKNPSAAFRKFHIRSTGKIESPFVHGNDVEWVHTEVVCEIAYPKNGHRGGYQLDELLEEDMRLVNAAIGTAGYATHETAAAATVKTIESLREEGDACTFSVLRLDAGFWRRFP